MNAVAIFAGIALLCVAWFGPLPRMAGTSFVAHMAVHVAVVAVAAPLIAAGLVRVPRVARRMPYPALSPIPASLLEFAVVWGWHMPAAHMAARSSATLFAAEQASFLLAGLLLWASALRRCADEHGGRGAGILALLLTSMHMILLGTLLALATRPLYHHAGAGALADQQLGGMLMLLGGGVPYLLGALWLVWGLLQPVPRAALGSASAARSDPP